MFKTQYHLNYAINMHRVNATKLSHDFFNKINNHSDFIAPLGFVPPMFQITRRNKMRSVKDTKLKSRELAEMLKEQKLSVKSGMMIILLAQSETLAKKLCT